MTRESLQTPEDRRLLLRTGFQDEYTERRNGGEVTNVSMSHGIATFNGASSKIDYGTDSSFDLSSNFSIRIKIDYTNNAGFQTIIAKGAGNTTQYVIDIASNDKIRFYGYEATNAKGNTVGVDITEGKHEIVCTFDGTTWNIYLDNVKTSKVESASLTNTDQPLLIGSRDSNWLESSIDLVETYNYVLSSPESFNLANSRRFRALTGQDTILDISAASGTILDRQGNSLTKTAMSVFKDGNVRVMKYNGASSVVETTLANDINSVGFWMKPATDTESIIDLGNGNTITTSGGTLTAAWADDLYVNGAAGTAVTTGKWNLILCTVDTAIAITDIDIGKISAAFYKGLLDEFKIHEGVVVVNESSQAWSNGRILYGV